MPNKIIVPYVDEESSVFKSIKRPKISLSIYSKHLKRWIKIDNTLADTGADISVLPRNLGNLIIGNYKSGQRYKISGLSTKQASDMYIHKLTVRLGDKQFRTSFAISDSDDIPPTLGRMGGLDKFDIRYQKGKKMIINW